MFAAELSSVGAAPASPQAAVGLKWAGEQVTRRHLELLFTSQGLGLENNNKKKNSAWLRSQNLCWEFIEE